METNTAHPHSRHTVHHVYNVYGDSGCTSANGITEATCTTADQRHGNAAEQFNTLSTAGHDSS